MTVLIYRTGVVVVGAVAFVIAIVIAVVGIHERDTHAWNNFHRDARKNVQNCKCI